jgi:hypothetical protein
MIAKTKRNWQIECMHQFCSTQLLSDSIRKATTPSKLPN